MRTMILTSAGMQVKDKILNLLPAPAEMLKLAHITTATKDEKDLSYFENEKELLKQAGFQIVEMDLDGMNFEEAREKLLDFDIVYIQGGNTFTLMNAMHKCNFAAIVRELLDEGVVYVGVSAGSIVAGPDIAIAEWKEADENLVNLQDQTGLFLVDFGIYPHFSGKMPESVAKKILKAPYKVKFLKDDELLFIRGDKVQVV